MVMFVGAFAAKAVEMRFEENWVKLQDGQLRHAPLHYNQALDQLVIKGAGDEELVLTARQVLSFSYEGHEYYSLPIDDGGYGFFRVLYEGNNFAVLDKPANLGLLEYVVRATNGAVQMCEDSNDPATLVLCEAGVGPSYGMPTFGESSVQYTLQNAVFVAVEGQIHLVSCKYDTKGQLFASVPGLQKKNRRLLKRLQQVVQDEHKITAIRRYAAAASADLEDPEQLIKALKTVYN